MTAESTTFPSAAEIDAAIVGAGGFKRRDLATAFRQQAASDDSNGWTVLSNLFNMHFKPSDINAPYGPMIVMEQKRSLIPLDVTDEQLDTLTSLARDVSDPEFKALIWDVLWLRRRDPKYARHAATNYMESGTRLEDPEHWPPSMNRFERAARLARQIDTKGPPPQEILAALEQKVLQLGDADPKFFTLKGMELLAEMRAGDFPVLADLAERLAVSSRTRGGFERARKYYAVQIKLRRYAKEPDRAEAAAVDLATCFAEEAEAREKQGEFMIAHHFWADAIKAFRERPSLKDQLPELQRRHTAVGSKIQDEMMEISSDAIDISKYVTEARHRMKDLAWEDAFLTFLTIIPFIDPDELRRDAQEQIDGGSISLHMPMTMHDASGRKVGVRPSIVTEDPAQFEQAVRGIMEQQAGIHRDLYVQAHVAPALRQLLEDHAISEDDIARLLTASALVPEDRVNYFVNAVVAGFKWDFATALHILIPQIENSLRFMLTQKGVTPSNMDANGIEEVWGLERILRHDQTPATLGPRVVFELQSLLVERLGPNFRNLLAHGLLPSGQLQSTSGFYLWWLIIAVVMRGSPAIKTYLGRAKNMKSAL